MYLQKYEQRITARSARGRGLRFLCRSPEPARRCRIILDRSVDPENNVWVGRSYADAPDVDALVYVTGEEDVPLAAGLIVPCEVVTFQDYDLVAAAVGNPR